MASLILGTSKDVLIYLAGPLFSEAERRFNLELTHRLEAMGFEVFNVMASKRELYDPDSSLRSALLAQKGMV